jgi:hypothetical protein
MTPLDPQARIGCLDRSQEVGRGASSCRFAPGGRGESGESQRALAPVIGSPDSLARRHLRRVCRVSGPPLAPVRPVLGSPGVERPLMPIRISDGLLRLGIDGPVAAALCDEMR